MDSRRLGSAWLTLGVLWFLLGIAWAPSSKLYQQGLVALFWLPVLLLVWPERERLLALWDREKTLVVGVLFLAGWALVSAAWSAAEEPAREAKRILYALLFLVGLVLLSSFSLQRLVRLLQVAGFGLAMAALASLVIGYGLEQRSLRWWRLEGLGQLQHPILGGYVIGLAAIWWFCLPPRATWGRVLWAAGLLVMLAFMLMTQSRGVWIALLATTLLMPFWRGGRASWVVCGVLLLVGGAGYWQFEAIVNERGTSFRPEILHSSLQMIAEHPWLGLGVGSAYQVQVESLGWAFDHSHNVFTHIAIELGVPGLLSWLVVWSCSFLIAWQQRATRLGSALLAMLLFSTLALLFDGANLWDSPRPEWFLTWLPVGLALGLRVGSQPPRGDAERLCYHAAPPKS